MRQHGKQEWEGGAMGFQTRIKEFEYVAPTTLEEASNLHLIYGEKACILAGGTDIVPLMKRGLLAPECVIDISRIPDMSYIRVKDGVLKLGSLTTIEAIRKSPLVQENCRALHMASEVMGSTIIRNVATIGANICRASPASDMVPPLVAVGASLKIFGPKGIRTIPLEDFFLSFGKANIAVGEILCEIEVPTLPDKQAFIKLRRTKEDLAKINISTAFNLSDGKCVGIKIALGSVAPRVVRAKETEKFLEGKDLGENTVEEATQIIQGEIEPIDDVRSTADYRREMSKVILRRAIRLALERGE
ncbi:MAG: xanthine dehydrogenase family protein subunit M [Deltaproteobacteria bacterium]|nr:xanthine dehydrogenase family protein subunit M [Deltaproteobacteria bacterium]MBW2044413.1 xanthine dehydrogenase family protein subunit M [Deltaproteobacteria bacterium]